MQEKLFLRSRYPFAFHQRAHQLFTTRPLWKIQGTWMQLRYWILTGAGFK